VPDEPDAPPLPDEAPPLAPPSWSLPVVPFELLPELHATSASEIAAQPNTRTMVEEALRIAGLGGTGPRRSGQRRAFRHRKNGRLWLLSHNDVFEGTQRSAERPGRRKAIWSVWCALALGSLALVRGAQAQEAASLRARASFGAALMTSPDQTGRLGFDTFGPTGHLHIGYAFLPWMSAQLGFGAAAFPAAEGTGAAIAPTLGVLATLPEGGTRPFVYLDGGAAFTGPISRPYFHGGVGIDFQLSQGFTLGPFLGYAQVFQGEGKGYSTDARSVELCATVTLRPGGDATPRPERVYVREERVTEIRTQAPPPEPMPPHEPSPELVMLLDSALPKARVELLAPVLFKLASDELEPIGIAMLHEVARELKARRDIRLIEIQGYADSRGSDELNQEISARRADRVLAWLIEHGVEPERLRTAARGEHELIEQTANTEGAHEQNRRVVFRVIETEEP